MAALWYLFMTSVLTVIQMFIERHFARGTARLMQADPDQPNMYSPASGRYIQAMPPPCSVLLDLDGTLVDSQPGISASCLAALRALGYEPDEPLDIKRIIGPPLEDIMRVLLQPYGDDRIDEAVAAYRRLSVPRATATMRREWRATRGRQPPAPRARYGDQAHG